MNKILLCFFLLTTLNFYSQVSDIIHCSGDITFDLTQQQSLLTGNLNPAETTISYHLTLNDATNRVNAIANPDSFVSNLASQKIYARIDYIGVTTINYFSVIVNSPLISVAMTNSPISCINNAIITATASGGQAPYLYSIDGKTFQASNTFSLLTPGIYSIIVKDVIGCITTSFIIIEQPIPLAITTTSKNVNCYGGSDGSITINATGGQAPYNYSIGNGYVSSNTFDYLSAGYYNVSVKDNLGCVYTMVATIVEPTPLSMIAVTTNSTTSADNDGTITVNAMGGVAPYSYAITDNFGLTIIPFQTSNVFTGLKAESYDVEVRDAKGCTNLETNIAILNNPNSLVASVDVTQITCNNPLGIITANATGGLTPYQYSFDNGATYVSTNVFTVWTPGSYSVKIRDAENTIASINAVITPANLPVITATLISNILCKGDNTGVIISNATAGVSPYSYSLDNSAYIIGSNIMTYSNLSAGTHNITMKDANGCLATVQIAVSEPVSAITTVTTVKNQTITVNASGGGGNYKYAISPKLDEFSTTNVFSELTPGFYTLNISDENGCYITMNTLVEPPTPKINGQIKLTIEFKPGQTLADLIIDGQNIKWYINQNPLAGKTNKRSETPLPLTTVIVEGTTYYASQTINGIESTERLSVTVKSSTLGTNNLVIKNFTYYPNPVKNVLTISNTSIIDEVTLTSIKGEILLTKQINSLHSEIDLSNFSKGIYFMKVKSENREKTVKIIKE